MFWKYFSLSLGEQILLQLILPLHLLYPSHCQEFVFFCYVLLKFINSFLCLYSFGNDQEHFQHLMTVMKDPSR